jgi:hypothetical protein
MRFNKFLTGIIICLVLASCQKELASTDPSTPGNPTPATSKVKTYTEDVSVSGSHTVNTYNLSYDASDRLTAVVSASSPGDKFVFQYSNGSFTMDLYNSNVVAIHEVFFVNSNSLVDSTFQYNDTNDSSTEKYEYNTSKQLTKVTEYDYSLVTGSIVDNVTNYLYDSNGNAIKVTDNFSVTTYDYYTNLVNNIQIFPYEVYSKGLIKTGIYDDGSGDILTAAHTYTFDSANRLITDKTELDTGDVVIKSYTYF